LIPDFTTDGLLPPGLHVASPEDVAARFAWTTRRRKILHAIGRAARALEIARCRRFWIDGSFATAEEEPGDWDGCWDVTGVQLYLLDPVLKDFSDQGREAMKLKYLGDLFPSKYREQRSGSPFLDYFQMDKQGRPKGILEVRLSGVLT
jgi:hypothetical protein